jgi:hypothetical protein
MESRRKGKNAVLYPSRKSAVAHEGGSSVWMLNLDYEGLTSQEPPASVPTPYGPEDSPSGDRAKGVVRLLTTGGLIRVRLLYPMVE